MSSETLLAQASITPAELRDAVRDVLEADPMIAAVSPIDGEPLGLEITTHRGGTTRSDLTRMYDSIVRWPELETRQKYFRDHIAAAIEATRDMDGQLAAHTRGDLVPVVKSKQWLHGARTAAKLELATIDLVGDLVIVYAWDRPMSLAFATPADIATLELPADQLYALALDNLRRRLPAQLSTRTDGRSLLIAAGGNFESSLILLPEIWDGLAQRLAGELVACVLVRDICLVTATGIPGGIESLIEARERNFASGLQAYDVISTKLIVRRGGTWHEYAAD